MRITFCAPSKCTSRKAWLYRETTDFIRLFGIEMDWRIYRVAYPDGAKSILMTKKQAKEYSEIFGGTIERV